METINTSELCDENVYPGPHVLENILADSYRAYGELLALYDKHGLSYTWRYYHDGKAWLCKVQKKNKTIVWMSAWKGYMQATIYFPAKDIEGIYALTISEIIKEKIRKTAHVGQSKPCIFEIRDRDILADFETVMQFKMGTRMNNIEQREKNYATRQE